MTKGKNDWKNIPEIVRVAILGLFTNIQEQDRDFFDYKTEHNITQFKREVREELEAKANLEDVKQTLDHVAESVEDKVSRSEV